MDLIDLSFMFLFLIFKIWILGSQENIILSLLLKFKTIIILRL